MAQDNIIGLFLEKKNLKSYCFVLSSFSIKAIIFGIVYYNRKINSIGMEMIERHEMMFTINFIFAINKNPPIYTLLSLASSLFSSVTTRV